MLKIKEINKRFTWDCKHDYLTSTYKKHVWGKFQFLYGIICTEKKTDHFGEIFYLSGDQKWVTQVIQD